MNIVLVGINAKYAHTNPAIRYLQQYCGDPDVHIAEYTINMDMETVFGDLLARKADAYGFSVYIWNVRQVYWLADRLRIAGKQVFMGGPEVTYDAGTALKHCDWVLYGEGEEAFRRLVQALRQDGDISEVPSLCRLQNGQVYYHQPAPYADMDALPQPYADLDALKGRLIYYESSRGCPFSCAYCLSSAEKHLRFASAEKVCRDIRTYAQAGVMKVKFVDRTFNADRKRAARIVRDINQYGGDTEFHFEMAADLIDEEMINALAEAKPGKLQLEIGVQSTYGPTLQAIDRVQDFSYTANVVKRILQKGNVHIHLDLIAGLPLEGLAQFKQSFDDVMSVGAQVVQLGFLKVLKGSRMEALTEQYGIVASDTAPYEVRYTHHISARELDELRQVEYLLERIYNSGLYYHTVHQAAKAAGSYYAFLLGLQQTLVKQGRDARKLSEQDLAMLLWDQAEAYPQEKDLLRDMLRLDWFLRPRRALLPGALECRGEWQRHFYAHMPDRLAEAIPKGKRPWHYSRVEKFCFDVTEYLQSGNITKLSDICYFDYTSGGKPEVLPIQQSGEVWQIKKKDPV